MAGIGEESPESLDSRGSALKRQKKLKGEDEFRFVHGEEEIEEVVEKEEEEEDDEGERVNEGEEEEEERGGGGKREVAEEEEDEVVEEEEWEEEEEVDEDGGEKEGSRAGQKLEEEEEEEETSSVFLSDDDEEEDVGDYYLPNMFNADDVSDPEDAEEVRRYIRQVNESQGFYVDFIPKGLKWNFGKVFPVDFDEEYHMKNADTCVKEAVSRYNKRKMKKLEFVRIVHVTRASCAGYKYAITFEAKNLSGGEILMYQTRVYHGIRGQMLVCLFRRKRGDALKSS